jgi:hypothetical protein
VLPRNDVSLVNRTIARFGLDAGQYVTLTASGGAPTHLPLGEPYPLLGILAGCVELQDVASRAGLAAMAAHLPDGPRATSSPVLAGTDDESRARYREKIAFPGTRCSTCSRPTPSATFRSRSSSTSCRRCARGSTRSPRRRRRAPTSR